MSLLGFLCPCEQGALPDEAISFHASTFLWPVEEIDSQSTLAIIHKCIIYRLYVIIRYVVQVNSEIAQ